MAFTVENGTNVADANSLVSVAEADAYHLDRGNAEWAGTDAVKQSALIKATDYITQNYDGRWTGEVVSDTQSLAWPRKCTVVASNVVPALVKHAVCLLALEALTADLNPVLERGGAIKREKVDVIETEYMDGAPVGTVRPAVDGLLKKYLRGPSINRRVVRV
ncbi:MAG: hypothetical protein JWO78_205 [Micavibrio sp.]|nr:hypothetical protein [Micavibrio sp.]